MIEAGAAIPSAPIRRRMVPPPKSVVKTDVPGAITYPAWPLQGFSWSIAFIGLSMYLFAITTFWLPIGGAGMVIALLGLPFEKKLRTPMMAALAMGLVAWGFLGLVTSPFPEIVMDSMTQFAKVIAVIFVAVNVLNTRARFRCFLLGMMMIYAVFPIRGTLLEYFVHHDTIMGRAHWNATFSNPNDLAAYLILHLGVALGVLEVEKNKWIRLFAYSICAVIPLIILLTQSRAAFIALVIFGSIVMRKHWKDPRKLVAVGVLIGIGAFAAPSSVWERLGTMGQGIEVDEEDANTEWATSTTQRLEIWKVASSIVLENALTGVGMGAYANAHEIMAQRVEFKRTARGKRTPHSTYLALFAETGIVGAGLFIGMCVVTFRRAAAVRKLAAKKAPGPAMQLFYLEVGMYGYLVAGIWASLGEVVPTYLHLSLITVATLLLQEELDGTNAAAPFRLGARVVARVQEPQVAHARS